MSKLLLGFDLIILHISHVGASVHIDLLRSWTTHRRDCSFEDSPSRLGNSLCTRKKLLSSIIKLLSEMDPNLNNVNPRIATLLRFTYRANLVFLAGFAAWYMVKGPNKEDAKSIAENREKLQSQREES